VNSSTGLMLIAGWAQTERTLAPLVQTLCRGESSSAFAEDSMALTSVASLLDHENRPLHVRGPSAYAIALARRLDRGSCPATLVGWSMGGMVALEAAIYFPEKVRRLVLLSSCAVFTPPSSDPVEKSTRPVRAMIVGLHRDRRATLGRFFALVHSESGAAELIMEDLRQAMGLAPEVLVHGLDYLQTTDLRAGLSAVRVPTLLVHGTKDRVIAWQASQTLQAGIDGSALILVDGADHGFVATSPELVAPAIRRFLNGDALSV
jgi:pimeloyl-[acyl-carrier protein] methyl ester esterase